MRKLLSSILPISHYRKKLGSEVNFEGFTFISGVLEIPHSLAYVSIDSALAHVRISAGAANRDIRFIPGTLCKQCFARIFHVTKINCKFPIHRWTGTKLFLAKWSQYSREIGEWIYPSRFVFRRKWHLWPFLWNGWISCGDSYSQKIKADRFWLSWLFIGSTTFNFHNLFDVYGIGFIHFSYRISLVSYKNSSNIQYWQSSL